MPDLDRPRTQRYSTTILVVLIGLVAQALITIYVNPTNDSSESKSGSIMPTISYEDEEAVAV